MSAIRGGLPPRGVRPLSWLLLAVMALGSAAARASDEPVVEEVGEHQPRHGGQFGDADDVYHYEVLLDPPRRLRLYVNDEHNQPLDVRSLEGRWTLEPDGDAPTRGPFTPSPDGAGFLADLSPPSGDPVHVEVAVRKDDVGAPMEFFLPLPPHDP